MRFIEILLALTVLTGLIWLVDSIFFRPKRMLNIFQLKGEAKQQDHEPMIVEYSRAFFPILLLVLILRTFLAEPFRIPSGSMHPTLLEGDFILVNKYNYGLRLPITGTKILDIGLPKRGDVVVFKHTKRNESIDMIKRVVGLPGDHVSYKDNTIYINGKPVEQELVGETIDKEPGHNIGWPVKAYVEKLGDVRHNMYVQTESHMDHYRYNDIVVPENSYFVMGDNRDNSDDSRFWGFVKDEDILGRALIIWFSIDNSKTGLDWIMKGPRWDRIGDGLALKEANKADNSDKDKGALATGTGANSTGTEKGHKEIEQTQEAGKEKTKETAKETAKPEIEKSKEVEKPKEILKPKESEKVSKSVRVNESKQESKQEPKHEMVTKTEKEKDKTTR